ncbi:MAG: OmpA family protein [Polyangiaceae bacterium]|jgi:peptidoglycan-associated lipoprotein
MRIQNIALSAGLALAMIACGHDAKPPQTQSNAGGGVTITNAAPPPADNHNAVSMSKDLRSVCGIEDTGAAPKFDFDSALLSPPDRSELDQLAKCMTTGPLTGKNVELIGRADPRGEAEYNMNLGATRANAVKHYLAQLGITPSRFTTTSRGSLDAQGHDEASWAVDRRVDLDLAGR